MARLKGPIPIVLALAAVAYGVVLLTEGDQPGSGAAPRKSSKSRAGKDAVADARAQVCFPRYQAANRNSFSPGIVAEKAGAMEAPVLMGESGMWALTGISTTNGVTSALLENGSTHETAFVHAGEKWNGLTVAAIEPTEVVFRDKQGGSHRVTFAIPTDEIPVKVAAGTAANPFAAMTNLTPQQRMMLMMMSRMPGMSGPGAGGPGGGPGGPGGGPGGTTPTTNTPGTNPGSAPGSGPADSGQRTPERQGN